MTVDRPDARDMRLANKGGIDLVPIRIGGMLASPFAFLRGSAAVMAVDLRPRQGPSSCAATDLANFGVFASPDARLVFDLNDFDETYRGSGTCDYRAASSVAVRPLRRHGDMARDSWR